MRRPTMCLSLLTIFALACGDDGSTNSRTSTSTSETAGDGDGDGDPETGESTAGDGDGGPGDGDGDGDGDPGDGDGDGDGDGEDMGCQPTPDACEPDLACDVVTGECVDPETPCALTGPLVACDAMQCGPGSACDDQGACIPLAPCGTVVCDGSVCWGDACICDRPNSCATATVDQLNGPFASDIFDLEFADDCTAWMVTLRSGTDYLRRMTPDGTMTEWAGVANLNMGEVKVLKALNPQLPPAPPLTDDVLVPNPPAPKPNEFLGEVAITYTCCPTCGCFVDPPQGVARLIEGDMVPLPIVLPGVPTQGTDGPFGSNAADAGPMGLTWGENLQLYVGNSEANGNFDTADLDAQTQQLLTMFGSRVTAAAPLTAVHLLVALDTGELLRFNTVTNMTTPVVDLMIGVTSLSHDSFTGLVYASRSDLSIVSVDPFTGEVADFGVMPALGRVAVSPDGKLWWVPGKYAVGNMPLTHWDLPSNF